MGTVSVSVGRLLSRQLIAPLARDHRPTWPFLKDSSPGEGVAEIHENTLSPARDMGGPEGLVISPHQPATKPARMTLATFVR